MTEFNTKKCLFSSFVTFTIGLVVVLIVFINSNSNDNFNKNETTPISQVSTNLNSEFDPNLTNEFNNKKIILLENRISNLEEQIKQIANSKNLRGIQGQKGADGLKGDKGDKGADGLKGEKGDKGADGLKGDKGANGLRGEKGDKGDKGADGKDAIVDYDIIKNNIISKFKVETFKHDGRFLSSQTFATDEASKSIKICQGRYEEKKEVTISFYKPGNYILQATYKCTGGNIFNYNHSPRDNNGGSMNVWKVNDKVVKSTTSMFSECDFSSTKKGSEIKVTQPVSLFLNYGDKVTFSVSGKFSTVENNKLKILTNKYKCLSIFGSVFYYED